MLENATFHHVGYAVNSIEEAKTVFLSMGYNISESVVEPIQKVRVAYASKSGSPTIEMLEPLDEKSPVVQILKKNGCTPYHICYAVDDLDAAIKEAKSEGFIPLAKPIPGHGLDDALMLFLYKKNIGLIQIMQNK